MGKKIRYTYCQHCRKEVDPVKKSMDAMEKTIWIVIILATLGIAIIALIIWHKFGRKKNYCPTCESKLIRSDKPFEKPKELKKLTKKEEVLEKVKKKKVKEAIEIETIDKGEEKEEEEEEKEEKISCPYCGQTLSKKIVTCPYCKTAIKG
ncbi:MAG: LITAF-like zinc ribbon domain-containing protein [Promethearchaeota archaeon]